MTPAAVAGTPAPDTSPETSVGAAATPGGAFDPAAVTLELEPVVAGLEQPLFVTHAGDGRKRLFAVEKAGVIRLLPDKRVFLDIRERVGSDSREQGLLGLAFHPRFRQNGYFYVNYTDRQGDTVVARYSTTRDHGAGDPASEQVILNQDQPAPNHNGGMLAFGPDGYLYIGLGDGGGANDTYGNGQNPASWLAKILRIDVNGGQPYTVPRDNPFVRDPKFKPETWAWGLRNPWRFSFDRVTGDLYIGDVGQNAYEWVLHQPAGSPGGQNYGWPITEGNRCLDGDVCDRTGITPPITGYTHDEGCSIAGGYVYRGQRYASLTGAYLFADYCDGRIWSLHRDDQGQWITTELTQVERSISSFGEDEDGELYITDLDGGAIYRITTRSP